MLKKKAFTERTTFLEENFTFLAQTFSLKEKLYQKKELRFSFSTGFLL
jgi:hypothetical protein